MTFVDHLTQITNVLVIGCGGAGLRSAIEIKEKGEDIHAMVRLQSPPTLFDVSDLRGWD